MLGDMKKFFSLLLSLSLSAPVLGVPTILTAENSGIQVTSSSATFAIDCTGAELIVVGGAGISSLPNVTGVTFNGDALTLIDGATTGRAKMYALNSPDQGSFNVVFNVIAAASDWGVAAVCIDGSSLVTPTEAGNAASNIGTVATVDVTTVADNDLVIDMVSAIDTTITVGASQTQLEYITGSFGAIAMSVEGPISPAGATTMSWTDLTAGTPWAIAAAGIRGVDPNNGVEADGGVILTGIKLN